ncbi:hypothetical protein NHG85_04425 [Limimaricola sp. ASW11-118]|uniref:Uncharacterized protein n=1 Tax=Limimaricola litoreus TaxID=2955316 RepID=A0A9X2FN97_9RHOB|nr:hypothetical protein [Limimaricola litoreus]
MDLGDQVSRAGLDFTSKQRKCLVETIADAIRDQLFHADSICIGLCFSGVLGQLLNDLPDPGGVSTAQEIPHLIGVHNGMRPPQRLVGCGNIFGRVSRFAHDGSFLVLIF